MSDKQMLESKIIHESADERQYVRVNIPAQFKIVHENHDVWCSLEEISLGGFSFIADQEDQDVEDEIKVGFSADAYFQFALGGITVQLEIPFSVVKIEGDRTSGKFSDLDKEKREVLRYIIGAYLSGELVNLSGVVNVLQRESFIAQRKSTDPVLRSKADQAKSIVGTSIFALGALCVLSVLIFKIYGFVFMADSSYAKVNADGYLIKMPDNGYVSYMLKSGVSQVEEGQPLAVVATQLMTNLTSPDELQTLKELDEKDINVLLGKTLVETAINSPCDCYVVWLSQSKARFGYKDEELLYLVPKGNAIFIEAAFDYESVGKIKADSKATVELVYNNETYIGAIRHSEIDEPENVIKLQIVSTEKDHHFPVSAYGSPASVTLSPDFMKNK